MKKCVKCDAELKWGGFSRDQKICWSCTRGQAMDILENLTGEDRELFVWAMTVVGSRYGHRF